MQGLNSAHKASDLEYMKRFMNGLHTDQNKLREIQGAYDNLTLLGQLLCAGTDITSMRADFNQLADELLTQLARELRKKAVLSLASNAHIAIDVLVRNLFERTADIGFLATDIQIRQFAEGASTNPDGQPDPMRQAALLIRFHEYVQKYSVYHNIILLSPEGKVLAQLDDSRGITQSADPLIGQSLSTDQPYVETFRKTDLLPGETFPLIYSYRVMSEDGRQPVGVLCLCFKFEDECQRIFNNLVNEDDWTVVTILDQAGKIIASSNPYEFPEGAKLEKVLDEECKIVRFAGREYLATTFAADAYQGYAGPTGWVGHALSPLNHVFDMAVAHELDKVPHDLLDKVLQTARLFSPALRNIPLKASSIQNELNRAVWNGNIWLTHEHAAINTTFAKVLLWEIASTGQRTRNVFNDSTRNLYETVISSVLFSCGNQAALAIDIMDRNLYERANDCRWWALTPTFNEGLKRNCLTTEEQHERRRTFTEVLRTINELYTVYTNLMVFDNRGRIIAVSNPAYSDMIGQTLNAAWVRPTLGLRSTQDYCVSSFDATPLYGDRPTYIYSAAILDDSNREPLGGIAVIFDAAPQFESMLKDTLPRDENGCPVEGSIAVFADQLGHIISSTEPSLTAGSTLNLPASFFNLQKGASFADIVIWRERYYAVGSCLSAGYREYKGENDAYQNAVVALVLSPLSDALATLCKQPHSRGNMGSAHAKRQISADNDCLELATFYIGEGWYGIPSHYVLEAFEAANITAVPGMPSWVRGCIVHQGQTVAVVDLRGFLTGEPPNPEGQLVVMVKIPGEARVYGILVDALGEIPEIPSSRIDQASGVIAAHHSMTHSLVRPHASDEDKRILVILSVERMVSKLTGATEPMEAELSGLFTRASPVIQPLNKRAANGEALSGLERRVA